LRRDEEFHDLKVERLLKEAYPNHVYPIKHKLKDCNMMKTFMTSRSLTWDKELEEDPSGRDKIPFPGEDVVMTVYDGHPPPWRRRMSNLYHGTSTHYGQGPENTGM
jgi:hypothetical protein